MKVVKRITSLVMAVLMVFGIAAISASATDVGHEKLHQNFIAYLDANNVAHTDPNDGREISFVESLTYTKGITVFYGSSTANVNPQVVYEDIGNYCFYNPNSYHPYPLGIFVEKDGVVKTLKEAFDADEVDLDKFAAALRVKYPGRVTYMGDVNKEMHQRFIAYLDANSVTHTDPNDGSETSFVTFLTVSKDSNVFYGSSIFGNPRDTSDYIGDYRFFNPNSYIPYPLGIFAEKDGVVKTLKEAFDANEVDLDEVADALKANYTNRVTKSGDVNGDGKVDMEDVLLLQKFVAKLISEFPDKNYAAPDYFTDGKIDMADVLMTQKHIAGLL